MTSVRRPASGPTKAAAGTDKRTLASPLRREQITLLRETFALVKPHAAVAALTFYQNLFALDPSLRRLFHTDIERQGRKLMEALDFTVRSLEQPGQLVPVLEAMGRRHVAYGVRAGHYETVTRALLQTLRQSLAEKFTPEAETAWSSALMFVAEVMQRGAATVNAIHPPDASGVSECASN